MAVQIIMGSYGLFMNVVWLSTFYTCKTESRRG